MEISSVETRKPNTRNRIIDGIGLAAVTLSAITVVEFVTGKAVFAGRFIDIHEDVVLEVDKPNVRALVIDNPNEAPGTNDLLYGAELTDQHIEFTFQKANDLIKESTNGQRALNLVGITHVEVPPESTAVNSNEDEVSCYSLETIHDIVGDFLDQEKDAKESPAIILNDSPSCDYIESNYAAGAVNSRFFSPYTYYNQLYSDTIAHEFGHSWGLPHQAVIDCTKPSGSYSPDIPTGRELDSVERFEEIGMQIDLGCDPQEDSDGLTDNYSSEYSIMGSLSSLEAEYKGQAYTHSELSKMMPDKFKTLTVEPLEGVYNLSPKLGEISNIRIEIPTDHPLKQIDESINNVSFSLVESYNDHYDVKPIAESPDSSYVINTLPFTQLYEQSGTLCDTDFGKIIYMDEMLDIVVSARNCEGLFELSISTFAKTKEKRDEIKDIIDQYNEDKFGVNSEAIN